MTDEQVSLVKNSWKMFQAMNPVLVGDVFYSKLFMTAPRLKHMFHISREEQSKNCGNAQCYRRQARSVE